MTFRRFTLIVLIIFLPLSAWLVSVTGQPATALLRDFVLLGLLIWVLPTWRGPVNWWAVALIGWGLLSYFWRDESLAQWFRGARFVLEPIGLFLVVSQAKLTAEDQSLIVKAIAGALALVVLVGLVEYVFPALVRSHLVDETAGYLGQLHLAGGLRRMQSLLAGPNALGLYLLVTVVFLAALQPLNVAPVWRRWLLVVGLAALTLTFSRSAWLGLAAAVGLAWATFPTWPVVRRLAAVSLLVLTLVAGIWLVGHRSIGPLERNESNAVRLEQYQRLWQQRGEVGLLGRGIGSAGLVSQNRLDGGPNYYTENSYLDMTEGLGLIGGLLYLGLWISLLAALYRRKEPLARAVWLSGSGLFVAGIFITHYTGQAAIWTFWLLAGLVLGSFEEVQYKEDGKNWP